MRSEAIEKSVFLEVWASKRVGFFKDDKLEIDSLEIEEILKLGGGFYEG